MVEEYASDSYQDGYDHGHSEGWDECKESSQDLIDEAYDEGYDTGQTNLEADEKITDMIRIERGKAYNEALDDMMSYIKPMRFVHTPQTGQELEKALEMFKDNAVMVQIMTYNYLHLKVMQMRRDTK